MEIDLKKIAYVALAILLIIAVNQYIYKPTKTGVVGTEAKIQQLDNIKVTE